MLVLLQLVERRHRQIHMSLADELRHEAVQEGQHQRIDVRAVHIGIRHDNDLVVTQLRDVKILVDAGAEGRDHGLDFLVLVDAFLSRLLDVQNFAAERQNRLRRPASGRLGGAACGISLDQENLTVLRILVGAVRQLSGQSHAVQCRFAAGEIPRSARRLSRALREH